MRKLILSVNVSMDGLMAGPNGELDWHYAHWNDEMAEISRSLLVDVDTIIAGRVTYYAMVAHWSQMAVSPLATDADRSYAKTICALTKIVFSTTLKELTDSRSRLAKTGLINEIMSLKQQPGKDIISWGGVNMAHSLIEANLVDVYQLWVAPVILNRGIPLFTNWHYKAQLKPVKTRAFSNGVMLYYYCNEKINHL